MRSLWGDDGWRNKCDTGKNSQHCHGNLHLVDLGMDCEVWQSSRIDEDRSDRITNKNPFYTLVTPPLDGLMDFVHGCWRHASSKRLTFGRLVSWPILTALAALQLRIAVPILSKLKMRAHIIAWGRSSKDPIGKRGGASHKDNY